MDYICSFVPGLSSKSLQADVGILPTFMAEFGSISSGNNGLLFSLSLVMKMANLSTFDGRKGGECPYTCSTWGCYRRVDWRKRETTYFPQRICLKVSENAVDEFTHLRVSPFHARKYGRHWSNPVIRVDSHRTGLHSC